MAKEMNYEALQANLRMIDKRGELAFEQARANGMLTPEQEKFSALISDKAFVEKFLAADNAEEAQALFNENGLELSKEEVDAFGKCIADISKKLIENGGELSEEELEQIAGGGLVETLGDMLNNATDGQANGLTIGLACGSVGGGIAGYKLGAAIGSVICPGFGTVLGGSAGAALGAVGGAIGGTVAGWKLGEKLPRLGKWIKSWF